MDSKQYTTIKSKLLFHLSVVVLITFLITILTAIYWANKKYDPLVFRDQRDNPTNQMLIGNPKKELSNSSHLILLPNFCKTIDKTGDVVAELVGPSSKIVLSWPPREATKIGCYPNPVTFKLPVTVNYEPRKVCFKISYKINPIRTIEENICSEEFKLIDEDGEPVLRLIEPSPTAPPIDRGDVKTDFSQKAPTITINNNIPPSYDDSIEIDPMPSPTPTVAPSPTNRPALCLLGICL